SGHSSSRSSSMARAYSAFSCAMPLCRLPARTSAALTSVAHVTPIDLPEAAHRRLGRARVLRLDAFATHVDDGERVGSCDGAALHEAADAAVLHGHVSRGPDQVRLLQAPALHLAVVVGEPEVRPVQLHRIGALRENLTDRETVLDLLQDE